MTSRSRFTVLVAASVLVLGAAAFRGRSASRVIATLGPYAYGGVAPSPDGQFLLVDVDDSLLLRVAVTTGAVTPVARGEFEDPALSPAGNRLAFTRDSNDHSQLWSARFDAARGTLDSVTRIADSAWAPAFSPDGRWIAFTRGFGNGTPDSLAVVSITGERRAIPAVGGIDLYAAGWSRDGRAIYYTAALGGPRNDAVYEVDLSTGARQLLIDRNFWYRARVSSDGRYLLYRPNSARFSVATVNGAHMADIDVEQFGFGRTIGDPQWLPGTASLVFSSRTEPRSLMASTFDGAEHVILSDSGAFTVSPSLSPDGKWLAAITAGPGHPRILIQPTMGGETRRIEMGTSIAQISPNFFLQWSPDGRYLAVPVGNADGLVGHVNPAGLAVVDVREGSVRQLATAAMVFRYIWTPDSRAIRYNTLYDSAAGPHRPMEIRETSLDGGDRLVRELNQCCGGATFLDFEHAYTKADGQLTDLRTGTHRTVIDPANLPVPDPGNVIPMACFTPDGKNAALVTSASGRGPYNRVLIVSMESGERRIADGGVTGTSANSIFCHPDSKHVVITGFDSARVHRAVSVAIDGSSRRAISEVDRDVSGMFHMTISPDGKWLITSRKLPAGPLQIVTQAALPGARH
jgi:Tol biopolymer transport system component